MSDLEYVAEKFVFRVRRGLLYSRDDAWARTEGEMVGVGLTDYAQKVGGDVVFVEAAKPGTAVATGDEAARYETIKVSLPVLSPVSGVVARANSALEAQPELINTDPYGEGWIVVVKPNSLAGDSAMLLTAEQYFEVMREKIDAEVRKKNEA